MGWPTAYLLYLKEFSWGEQKEADEVEDTMSDPRRESAPKVEAKSPYSSCKTNANSNYF